MSILLLKNLLTQWDSWGGKPKADEVRLVRRPDLIGWMKNLTWLIWWKTSQPKREMGEENWTILDEDPINLRRRKALSEKRMRAMRRRRLHLSPRRREQCMKADNSIICWWSEETQSFIPCRRGDKSNAMKRASFHVVEGMRAMQWGRLYPTSWRGWEQCAAAPNW